MRNRSAAVALTALSLTVSALLVSSTGCAYSTHSKTSDRPSAEPVRTALKGLGADGRSYVNDLGAVSSIHIKGVHVFGDDVMIEDIHGNLVYIDAATLFARWEYRGLGAPFDMKPSATATAVVGVAKGRIHVLSRSAGVDEITPKQLPIVSSGAPVSSEETLYVPTYATPSGNKTLQSVSLGSGYAGWGWRTNSDIVAGAALGGTVGSEIVYAADSSGSVYAFPAATATTRDVEPSWAVSVHSPVTRDLVVDGDDLGLVTADNRLVCLDRIGGNVRFEGYAEPGEKSEGTAQFGPSHVYYVCGGELRAFDRKTGAKAWAVKGATRFVAQRGDRTIVWCPCGTLKSVETKTGKVLSSTMMAGWTFPARAKADATIIAVSDRGMLVSVESGF